LILGVPRNISNDVKQHEFVKSFDVDDLQEVVSRNQEFRQKIAKEAESLVERKDNFSRMVGKLRGRSSN